MCVRACVRAMQKINVFAVYCRHPRYHVSDTETLISVIIGFARTVMGVVPKETLSNIVGLA